MKKGATLLETLVACAVLSLLMIALFALFRMGTRMFQLSITRQGLEGEARRVSAWLEKDLRRTVAASTVLDTSRPQRHGLCCPTLARWDLPTSYSPQSGLPDWDRYLSYYANNTGHLYRCLYHPGAAKAHHPWAAFDPAAHLREDPGLNSNQESYQTLADDVQELTFGTDGKSLMVKLILEKQAKTSELRLEIRPQNQEP
ncbi:MAG: hypothetical protein KF760_34740 [Candidatus Eremiobacteraeota bacterium]|nr:hypothetical protein [Candidatus Eremiobacteraeota bacterium]MCW5868423.1 hypothetical protein [Candidatus Eremiobacteraeota bacterium]